MRGLFVTVAALALAPGAALAAAPSHAVQRDQRAEATRLATLLFPEAKLLSLSEPMYDAIVATRLSSDPATKELFARRPELLGVLRGALLPELQAILRELLPEWRARTRDYLMSRMTADELGEMADFLDSPTGRKVYGRALDHAAAHPDKDVPDAEMVDAMAEGLTSEDYAVLDRVGRSPAAQKFGDVMDGLGPMVADWTEDMVQRFGPRIERVVRDALSPYLPRKK